MAGQHQSIVLGTWQREVAAKPEPLEWDVLEVRPDGSLLIMTHKIIEFWPYHEVGAAVTWADSDLRYWLNTTFLTRAFSKSERNRIQLVENENPPSCDWGTPGGENTWDKVFCLSAQQVRGLLPSTVDRCGVATPYARQRGSYNWWWLRDPGEFPDSAVYVSGVGSIVDRGGTVNAGCVGVRPAVVVTPAGQGGMAASPLSNASMNGPVLTPRTFVGLAEALCYGDAARARRLQGNGCELGSRSEATVALRGGYGAQLAIASLPYMGAKTAGNLFKVARQQPWVAKLIVGAMDLDDFKDKRVLVKTLAAENFVPELRMLEGHEGYYTLENVDQALQVANEHRSTEAVAYLLGRRQALVDQMDAQGTAEPDLEL